MRGTDNDRGPEIDTCTQTLPLSVTMHDAFSLWQRITSPTCPGFDQSGAFDSYELGPTAAAVPGLDTCQLSPAEKPCSIVPLPVLWRRRAWYFGKAGSSNGG